MSSDSMNLLERLSNAIASTVNPSVKAMTQDEFVTYANEQIVALVKDPPDVAKARLAALSAAKDEAKKFLQESSVKIPIFDPAKFTAEHTETMTDPVKSNDRKDAEPKEGEGEQAVKSKKKKKKKKTKKSGLAAVTADLATILNPHQKQEGAAGGGGGEDEEEEDEEEEDEEEEEGSGGGMPPGMKKGEGEDADNAEVEDGWVEVNAKNDHELFPLDMNEHKRTKGGKILRKALDWGDDPPEVRGVG